MWQCLLPGHPPAPPLGLRQIHPPEQRHCLRVDLRLHRRLCRHRDLQRRRCKALRRGWDLEDPDPTPHNTWRVLADPWHLWIFMVVPWSAAVGHHADSDWLNQLHMPDQTGWVSHMSTYKSRVSHQSHNCSNDSTAFQETPKSTAQCFPDSQNLIIQQAL